MEGRYKYGDCDGGGGGGGGLCDTKKHFRANGYPIQKFNLVKSTGQSEAFILC